MRTLLALAIKFMMTFAAAVIAGFVVGVTNLGLLFLLAVVGTVVNYILGDLFVLPATSNTVASVADGGLAGALAYIIATNNRVLVADAIIFSVVFGLLVMVGEYFFHRYLKKEKHVAPNPERL